MKIKALRMFSHYHLGTVSQGETRAVKKEIGEVLVKMHLAVEVEPEKVKRSSSEQPEQPEKAKAGGKGGNKRGADGADKDASESGQ
ncbi:hypothetical protein C3E80_13830 [Cronobacter malonaticus]|uniref:Uncharacterized protein n=1 Tax=Cronobacter malonaticus TaxID=413503 RepID=A0A423XSH2_9ENTR|nr:hypothetical protein [Cronobacter malonaticus]ROW59484.1 hypothetical protein C3E80_13830 [Cronobacter malonaticus]